MRDKIQQYQAMSRDDLVREIRKEVPTSCEHDLYERGDHVFTWAIPAKHGDFLVRVLREMSGQRLDWHYVGGRNVGRADPEADQEKIREALRLIEEGTPSLFTRVSEIPREEVVRE